ncbi:MAG TPA: NlpC/P60 family protein [Thermotogota bacterium]|nr:NlpC/P60 family protein [Thermotogota bacterium]
MSKRSPRLQFSDEERASPELKKVIEKADKKADKLDKAEAKIPKKTVKRKERVVGEDGKVSVKLHFEEVDKKKPTSKLSHSLTDAPLNTVLATAHREVRDSEEDNVGVEGAHKLEQVAEGGVRTLDSAHRSHKLKPYREAAYAEKAADKANLKALNKQAQQNNPQFSSNPYSRWQQKRAIKKEYMAAKAGKTGATTAKATQKTAKSAKKAAENTKKTGTFLARHWKGALIVLALLLMIAFLSSVISSCSVLVQSGVTSFAASSYAADDADMLAAEEQYCALEAELQEYLDTYEDTHDYDEYHYDLDDIEHDPYVLISAISALHGGEWTIGEVGGTIQMLFDKQYILTETVTTETRYRTETRTGTTSYIDPETGETVTEEYEYEVQVPYTYYICNVTLENFNLSHVPVYIMSEEQLSMYATYMATLGNRPDLFPDSQYVGMYIDTEYEDYEIPAEALSDPQFAAMMEEAEKYLGYPYVWGGSSPSTSFDCSGFVSWVINNCGEGWSIGRLGAEGLRNTCSYVSPVNARPGDLIFFEGTYDTSGASHVGIYVGNNMMIHCGDPIQYASINTNYWQQHFLSFGRLPSP